MTNPWANFDRLIRKSEFFIVEVVEHRGQSSWVKTLDNKFFTVYGNSVDPSKHAYVRDGIITGEAPSDVHTLTDIVLESL